MPDLESWARSLDSSSGFRMIVLAPSGSGKTTLAQKVSAQCGVKHVEIDALYHGPNWTPRPEFVSEVQEFAGESSWVTEWQYAQARGILADRATVAVWLDYPRHLVMSRVIRRTLQRRFQRQVLWNGNVEPPLWTIFTDKTHIVRWSWQGIKKYQTKSLELAKSRPELPIIRCRHPRDAESLLTVLKAYDARSS